MGCDPSPEHDRALAFPHGLCIQRLRRFARIRCGLGTLEAFFETWIWAQLGEDYKPIGLLVVGFVSAKRETRISIIVQPFGCI